MKWVPRITYNATVLSLTLPQKLWTPEEGVGFGAEDVSAAGIPVSYWVRYDYAVGVDLRFTDAERASVMAFIEWALKNKGTAFTFQFDVTDGATAYTVYLEEPRVGDRVAPGRDGNAPWVWELPLKLRSANGTRIHQQLVIT